MYIRNLCVSSTSRRHGVGEQLIRWLLRVIRQQSEIECIYAHTAVSNKPVLAMAAKLRFQLIGLAEGYYSDLASPDAYVLFWCKPGAEASGAQHPLSVRALQDALRMAKSLDEQLISSSRDGVGREEDPPDSVEANTRDAGSCPSPPSSDSEWLFIQPEPTDE